MRKNIMKKVLFIGIVLVVCLVSVNITYAALGGPLDSNLYGQVTSEASTELDATLWKIAGSIMTILQVCALAGVVITGVKYMYAGSEDKGRIKQTLIWLVIGSVFVFAAPRVIDFVANAGKSIL